MEIDKGATRSLTICAYVEGSATFCESADKKLRFQATMHGTDLETVVKSGEVLDATVKVT